MRYMRKYILRTAKITLFLSVIVAVYQLLSFAFVDDIESMTRVSFHEFYERENEIEFLFIGPSHTQRGVDAGLVSEGAGRLCYNLGTTAQRLSDSYYLLKEALKDSKVGEVYLEVSFSIISSEDDEFSTYPVSDYMKFDPVKIEYLSNVLPDASFTNKWSPLCRSIRITSGLNVESAIKRARKKVNSDSYKSFIANPEPYEYLGYGSWKNISEVTFQDMMSNEYGRGNLQDLFVTPEDYDAVQLDYLDRIVDMCRQNNIALTIVIFPYADLYIASNVDNYCESIAFFQEYCEDKGVDFVDFNRAPRDLLKLGEDCFSDMDHLNEEGERIFSRFLAGYISGQDQSGWYENSWDRVVGQEKFFGVIYEREDAWDEQEVRIDYRIVDGRSITGTWRAEVVVDEDTAVPIESAEKDEMFGLIVPMEYLGKQLYLNEVQEDGSCIQSAVIDL